MKCSTLIMGCSSIQEMISTLCKSIQILQSTQNISHTSILLAESLEWQVLITTTIRVYTFTRVLAISLLQYFMVITLMVVLLSHFTSRCLANPTHWKTWSLLILSTTIVSPGCCKKYPDMHMSISIKCLLACLTVKMTSLVSLSQLLQFSMKCLVR